MLSLNRPVLNPTAPETTMRVTRKPSNLMEARMWRAYHQRRRPSSAVIVHTKGPSLPAQTWLQVFDKLARGGDYDAIAACADVCRVFAECSGRYINESGFCRMLLFGDEGDVYRARKKISKQGADGLAKGEFGLY